MIFTDTVRDAMLDLVFTGSASYTPATPIKLGLLSSLSPVVEFDGEGYERKQCMFTTATTSSISISAAVTFDVPQEAWDTIVGIGVWDSSGNLLATVSVTDFEVTLGRVTVIESLTLTLTGIGEALAAALLNHIFKSVAFTPLETYTIHVLTSYTDDETYTSANDKSFTPSTPSGGLVSNANEITFDGIDASVTHIMLRHSGGAICTKAASFTLTSGDPLHYPIGDLEVQLG